MTPRIATLMAEYNRWMNHRLFDCAATLAPSDLLEDKGAYFGSILGTLNHIAVGDTIWLHWFSRHQGGFASLAALTGFPCPTSLGQSLAPDVAGLRIYRQRLDDLVVRWAGEPAAHIPQLDPFFPTPEANMTPAARSIVYFGAYVILTGLVLLLAPNVLLSIFGLGSTTEVWIRVLGCVVIVLGAYYVAMGRAEATPFFRATIWGRAWIFVSLVGLVATGMAKPPLVLFASIDLLGAIWTWRALKRTA